MGAGRMGRPILQRWRTAGFEVLVHDPCPAADLPGPVLPAGRVLAAADVLVTALPGAAEVAALAPELTARLRPGSVWLDLTSGDPRTTDRLAAELAGRGVGTVAAAMGGGPADAAAGTLELFVGGAAADVERVSPLLGAVSRRVRRVGERAGAGQTAKLVANLLWFAESVAVTEALLLGRAAGLDPHVLREALAGSAGDSAFLQRHAGALLAGDHLTGFGLDRCVEELEVLAGLAGDAGTPYALHRGVLELHREALAEFGPVPGELLAAHLLQLRAGAPFRSSGG
nr:NAD(P)-binding domain-containing protein [Kineococcus aurantiacus]